MSAMLDNVAARTDEACAVQQSGGRPVVYDHAVALVIAAGGEAFVLDGHLDAARDYDLAVSRAPGRPDGVLLTLRRK